MTPNTIETLIAKQDIVDVIARYARGIDRGDAELLTGCYWEDAVEEHGNAYHGPAIAYCQGAAERVAKAGTIMQHFACNTHVELDGDTAWVETYLLTFARFAQDGEPWDTLTGARAFDRFERRGGEWRIAHRRAVFDWNRDQPSAETWALGVFNPADPRMTMGAKGAADPTYARR